MKDTVTWMKKGRWNKKRIEYQEGKEFCLSSYFFVFLLTQWQQIRKNIRSIVFKSLLSLQVNTYIFLFLDIT